MDLLLDTICNVFGGIIFLALLVVITSSQLATVPRESSPDDDHQPLRSEIEQQITKSQLDREVIASRISVLSEATDTLSQSLDPSLLNSIGDGSDVLEMLSKELEDVKARIVSSEKQIQNHLEAAAAAEARADAAHQAIEAATRRKAEIEATQQLNLRMPRERRTAKTEYPVFIARGRLFEPRLVDAAGRVGDWNFDEASLIGDRAIVPKRGGGTAVGDQQAFPRRIGALKRKIWPHQHYVCLVVWPDSYPEFQRVRDVLVEAGFEYRLILLEEDGMVAAGGGGDPVVQ